MHNWRTHAGAWLITIVVLCALLPCSACAPGGLAREGLDGAGADSGGPVAGTPTTDGAIPFPAVSAEVNAPLPHDASVTLALNLEGSDVRECSALVGTPATRAADRQLVAHHAFRAAIPHDVARADG